MKKLIPILCIYTAICALACILFGYFMGDVPNIVPSYEFRYRLYNGLLLFLQACPAILFTGITIGCAVAFGRTPEGSEMRFSQAMFRRFRNIAIVGFVCVIILTVAMELVVPILNAHQSQMAKTRDMVNDYVQIGTDLYRHGQYQMARQYGQRALALEENSVDAEELMQEIDIAIVSSLRSFAADDKVESRAGAMTAAGSHSVYELRQKAEDAIEQGDWFAAHYFAQTGLEIASERDMNRQALLEISSDAWSVLSAPHDTVTSETQKIFEKKLEGYSALLEGDNVHAYYVFRSLHQQSRALSMDPDVVRYLAISEERLLNECFFIDEQSFIRNFESATDVYFAMHPTSGNTQIAYIKGITEVKNSGGTVQYLRSFSLFNVDSDGNYISGFYVPYAKLAEADVSDFDDSMRQMFGISADANFVPEILLRSVDRNDENNFIAPNYYYKAGNVPEKNIEHIFLPISFSDYLLVTEASQGAENMGLPALYSFLPKAVSFGYAREIFSQVLIDRLFYPIFLLAVFLFLAAFAWDNRIDKEQLFKFKWIFTFPLFSVLFYYGYRALLWLFKLQNYMILAISNANIAIFVSAGFYILLIIIASIVFLSRNDSSRKERR